MEGTFWALLPPILAIVIALITKRVYISLLLGIFSGALLLCKFAFFGENGAIEYTLNAMAGNIGDKGNFALIVFLVLLGMLVQLMTVSNGTVAYGRWAATKIKSKRGALLATSALGALIFVDDYFNCLTVGTVMSPITDKYGVSRTKLAYIIDATAAPVCIIAPISSWGAAVASQTEGTNINGFTLMLKTIPLNLYALLTIAMIIILVILNFDFGPMRKKSGVDANSAVNAPSAQDGQLGKVLDLVLPIVVLIVSCIFFMLYTGGIFEGKNIVDSFANCSASLSLAYGSLVTVLFTFLLYIPRKVISIGQFCESFIDGFKSMLPAIVILLFAWSIKTVCQDMQLGAFVSTVVSEDTVSTLLPAICFLVALGIAFATGTSWGTFGILIPIVCAIADYNMTQSLVISTAAVLAGAVCGDHISPISDTTILASTGARCNHIDHVSTQMPYALLVAGCSFVGYLVAGLTQSTALTLLTGFGLLIITILVIYFNEKKKGRISNKNSDKPSYYRQQQ